MYRSLSAREGAHLIRINSRPARSARLGPEFDMWWADYWPWPWMLLGPITVVIGLELCEALVSRAGRRGHIRYGRERRHP
jgi:hypothetical protein